MNARAIAPALALLLLPSPLPASLGAAVPSLPHPSLAETAAPAAPATPTTSTPATAPAAATPPPPPSLPAAAGALRPGEIPTIADEKLFNQSAEAATETLQEFGPYDNPSLASRVNRIGYELAQHNDYYRFPITFNLVNMAEPNAFALPGGQIFVTRGMLEMDVDDDMMACLLGHEMGHVIKEHLQKLSHRAMLMSILGDLLVAGVLITSARNQPKQGLEGPYDPRYGYDYGDGNRVQGAAAASLVMSELLLRGYSRENEDEADLVGQQLAAAAGYDPDGTRRLWERMEARSPQVREYGYLQTHPFSQERLRAGEARKQLWSIQKRKSADAYRQATQKLIYDYAGKVRIKEALKPKKPKPPPQPGETRRDEDPDAPQAPKTVSEYLYQSSLNVWPRGPIADAVRLSQLHKLRDAKLASCPDLSPKVVPDTTASTPTRRGAGGRPVVRPAPDRLAGFHGFESATCAPELHDYGAVVRAYRRELVEVQSLDPTGPTPELVGILTTELASLNDQRQALYPHAVEVFQGGVFETPFLVAFLSNFPDAPEVPQVALNLGEAYSRTGNETDAVRQFLTAWEAGPETDYGKRARTGLRNLTSTLKELAALQELANQQRDPEMQKLADTRLAGVARSYVDPANGAEYLRRFPGGEFVIPVLDRLNVLADNLYGEVVLYQGLGDVTKASERINKILTNAPLSPAAEKLRDRAVMVAQNS
jgi:Zn-dependent protease with chaperone function